MPRQKKRILAASVIDRVKSMGGRFLEVNREVYSLATEARVLEKVCQALREKKWESRKSLLGPLYTNKSSVKKENKVPHDKAPKKSNAKVVKLSTPKKTSTTAAPSWPEQSPPKRPDTETPKAMNKEVEVGTRIEVYWPLDQKYYAAKVQAVNGHFVHLEYELDGVLEWLNLSEHIFRTIS